jgi:hypothetical protein
LDEKDTKTSGLEVLPVPRTSADFEKPLEPGDHKVRNPGMTNPATPLSSPPPQTWRDKHPPVIATQSSNEPAIKLERPVVRSRQVP